MMEILKNIPWEIFKKKPVPRPAIDYLDPFSENQCRLDDARLVMVDLCKKYDLAQVEGIVNEAWRQISNALFSEYTANAKD